MNTVATLGCGVQLLCVPVLYECSTYKIKDYSQLHKSVNYLIWSINNALKMHLIAFVWCTHIWDKVERAWIFGPYPLLCTAGLPVWDPHRGVISDRSSSLAANTSLPSFLPLWSQPSGPPSRADMWRVCTGGGSITKRRRGYGCAYTTVHVYHTSIMYTYIILLAVLLLYSSPKTAVSFPTEEFVLGRQYTVPPTSISKIKGRGALDHEGGLESVVISLRIVVWECVCAGGSYGRRLFMSCLPLRYR